MHKYYTCITHPFIADICIAPLQVELLRSTEINL